MSANFSEAPTEPPCAKYPKLPDDLSRSLSTDSIFEKWDWTANGFVKGDGEIYRNKFYCDKSINPTEVNDLNITEETLFELWKDNEGILSQVGFICLHRMENLRAKYDEIRGFYIVGTMKSIGFA